MGVNLIFVIRKLMLKICMKFWMQVHINVNWYLSSFGKNFSAWDPATQLFVPFCYLYTSEILCSIVTNLHICACHKCITPSNFHIHRSKEWHFMICFIWSLLFLYHEIHDLFEKYLKKWLHSEYMTLDDCVLV